MPDYDGPADRDQVLAALVSRHQSAGIPHTGQLFNVDEDKWNNATIRDDITKRIVEQLDPDSTTGFGSSTYALMHTLRDDAMACWKAHRRVPDCPDYKSDSKRLVPGTAAERKELGLDPTYDSQDRSLTRYLCEHCPVHSLVQQAKRKQAGLYN